MAATSYSTLPASSYVGYGSKPDPYQSTTYGASDTGLGSLASHPYLYETGSFHTNLNDNQHGNSNTYSNSKMPGNYDGPTDINNNYHNNNNGSYARANNAQPSQRGHMDNRQEEYMNQQQGSYADRTEQRPPAPDDTHYDRSNTHLVRSERQVHQDQTPPRGQNRSKSNGGNNNNLADPSAKSNYVRELKPTKSSTMRAAAIKDKEKVLEKKRHDRFFPSSQNKVPLSKSKFLRESPKTDGEQNHQEKPIRNKKESNSVPNKHGNHHNGNFDDDNKSSGDDDHHGHHRNKSHKGGAHDKHHHLPPIRPRRIPPPHYDPYFDYGMPPGHPMKGRNPYDIYPPYGPYHGPYGNPHHFYGDPDDIPPYLPPYHDPYDSFFDYQKRKGKPKRPNADKHEGHSDHDEHHNEHGVGYETEPDDGAKSQMSRKSKNKHHSTHDHPGRKSHRENDENFRTPWQQPGYYNPNFYYGEDMLEVWRQERNDYLKKKFKPSIHDVLYSQQWLKADGYLENQRRRVLRDAQGYYFPYKRYTLKDYKDMQKLNIQNPYAEVNESIIDRKERARKRQEYGTSIERQVVDNPGTRHIPPREIPSREPWHLSNTDLREFEKAATKRERALEYAKVQVKLKPKGSNKTYMHEDSNERHKVNNHEARQRHDYDESNYERTNRTNQSYDEYD